MDVVYNLPKILRDVRVGVARGIHAVVRVWDSRVDCIQSIATLGKRGHRAKKALQKLDDSANRESRSAPRLVATATC